MTHLTIDNKKYVLMSEGSYQELKKMVALKHNSEKTFSIKDARAFSKNLIGKLTSGDK